MLWVLLAKFISRAWSTASKSILLGLPDFTWETGWKSYPKHCHLCFTLASLPQSVGDFYQCGWIRKAKRIPLNIAVWNMLGRNNTDTPRRHTTLITSEFSRYKINIATLSETMLAGKGKLTEKSSDYSFFWSGCAPDDKCKARVGYAMKTSLVGKLASLPKGVNDLMTLRLPLHPGKKFATTVSTYVLTMTNTDETKRQVYEEFEYVISAVSASDKFIILGNLNARVGIKQRLPGRSTG